MGFDVIEKKWIFISALIVGVAGTLDLFFVDNIALRYGICAVIVALLSPPLISYLKHEVRKKREV